MPTAQHSTGQHPACLPSAHSCLPCQYPLPYSSGGSTRHEVGSAGVHRNVGTLILGEREVLWCQWFYHSKQRCWFSIGSPLWPFDSNLPSNVSNRRSDQQGVRGSLWSRRWGGRGWPMYGKPYFNAIWKRHWAIESVVCKRNRVDIFCHLSILKTRKLNCRWQTRATRRNVIVAPSGGTRNNINVIYTSMKGTFNGLQFCRWQYGSISIRLAVVAFQMYEIA